jgi:AcrR family transcriptional regulator
MGRLPVAERRQQLVAAAITVATRDGIDAATVRAIAAEAGVSLGVVHYCFEGKDELLLSMAHEITRQNLQGGLLQVRDDASPEEMFADAIGALWAQISATRGAQLLSYELTTYAMRHPELSQVSTLQYVVSHEAAGQFLVAAAEAAHITWTMPVALLARLVVMATDGVTLAWLADGDDEAALATLNEFGAFLLAHAEPAPRDTADDTEREPAEATLAR